MYDNLEQNPKSSKSKKIFNSKNKNHSTYTIPSVKENYEINMLNNQSNYQTINQTSKSFTIDDKTIPRKKKSKSRNNSRIKIPSSSVNQIINNESSLLKNIQFLDSDNVKLREALKEINLELQEKEESLNTSQKLLKKINNEYSQILNQYKLLEEEKNKLKRENERLQKMNNNLDKNLKNKEKKEKQNEQIKSELIKTKETLNNLKGNYSNITFDFNKIEKDMKCKEIIIKDLKIEGNRIVNMLQDRELLIQEYNRKISELNDIIKQKDEQLKLIVNFSKELNNENKSNVKEIAKQAVKTIKIFYNSKKNQEEQNIINLIEIKNNEIENINNIDDILSKNQCSFLIDNAIKSHLFIPENGANFINKEFLKNNNFKTDLIKTELNSSFLREFHLIQYMKGLFNKISEYLKDIKLQEKHSKSIKIFKVLYNKIYKDLIETKKENSILKTKLKELILYIKKLQKDFSNKNEKLKEKLEKINNQYISYVTKLELYIDNKDKEKNNNELEYSDNNSKIISELNKENDSIKDINNNLNEKIKNKEEIINKLREENNKLAKKLNLLRTNQNGDNYINLYNSYSTKENSIYPKKLLSFNDSLKNNCNNDLKIFTNKISNTNNNFDSFNNDESFLENNHKCTSYKKIVNKGFNNLKEIKLDTISYNKEKNNVHNNCIKSNNFNKNRFVNLQIEIQDNIFYNSINNLTKNNHNEYYNELKNYEKNNLGNINFILSAIKNFTSEINKEHFIDIINRIFNSNNIILMLSDKIGDIKNNLSLIKEKFKNNNKDKKIKSSQLLNIINDVEKLLFYLFNQLNKYNVDTQKISPFLKIIFNLVSTISYSNSLEMNNGISDITPITIDLNTLFNTSLSNYNNKIYSKKFCKDKILMNDNNNKKTREIDIKSFHNLFYINTNIFSSSELIKYRSIYDGLNISELISVFNKICENFKKLIFNSKFNYDTDLSDFEENNDIEKNKEDEIITENSTYHLVNEKIFSLKKFEFNLKLFFELLKNYLVVFELVVKEIEININNIQNKKELENILNNLYDIFRKSSYLNINSLDDNEIFYRKIFLTLLWNQKEYLSYFL